MEDPNQKHPVFCWELTITDGNFVLPRRRFGLSLAE